MTALDVASVNEHPDVFATLQLMSLLPTDFTRDLQVIYIYIQASPLMYNVHDFLYSTVTFQWRKQLMK